MIHESHPWKTQLAKDADLIERWAAKPRSSERRSFLIEQKVFLAAYAMRKLDDATKLSTDLLASRMPVLRFPPVRDGYSVVDSHKFDEFFDLEKPEKVDLKRRRLLDVLIHSLVFVEMLGETDVMEAFLVTSDQEQAKGLIQVDIATFVELMRLASADYPKSVRFTLDAASGRWGKWAGRGGGP